MPKLVSILIQSTFKEIQDTNHVQRDNVKEVVVLKRGKITKTVPDSIFLSSVFLVDHQLSIESKSESSLVVTKGHPMVN